MEKNQAKRIHSGGGDGQKIREGGSKHMREGKRDESEKNKLKRTRERNLPAYNTQAHEGLGTAICTYYPRAEENREN